MRHFGIMVRDEAQIAEVRDKLINRYGFELIPECLCDFHDPFGNRIQVVDLPDESLIWLFPSRTRQPGSLLPVPLHGTGSELKGKSVGIGTYRSLTDALFRYALKKITSSRKRRRDGSDRFHAEFVRGAASQ